MNGNSTWATTTNWTPTAPVGGPNAAGLFVLFNNNITNSVAVGLGSATETVGRLDVGDLDGTNGFTFNTGTINFTGTGGANGQLNQLSSSSGQQNTFNTAIVMGSNLDVSNASTGNLALNGVISGAFTLTKTGTGSLSFNGQTNTFNGGFNINGGTVSVGNAGPLGAGVVTVNSGGTLRATNNNIAPAAGIVFNGGTYDGLANNSNFTGQGNVTVASGGATFISDIAGGGSYEQYTFGTLSIGTATLTAMNHNGSGGSVNGTGQITFGTTTLTGDPTFNTTTGTTSAIQINVGALSDGGVARTLTFSGVGGTVLGSAAGSLVDGTQVNVTSGKLTSNNATALGSLAAVNVSAGATLTLGAAQTFGSLSGAGAVTNGGNTLTVGNTNNLSSTYSGVLGSGAGALIKAGTGTLALSGANTYTGGTTINTGTLLANSATVGSSSLGTNTVTVSNGATLGGTGMITLGSGKLVTVSSGATLLGGDGMSTGTTLTINNGVTFASGSILEFTLGPSNASSTIARSAGTWTFTLAAGVGQNVEFLNPQAGTNYVLLTGLAAAPADLSSWMIYNTPGFTATFSYSGGNVLATVVPEPTTITLIGLVLLSSLRSSGLRSLRKRFRRA